MKKSDPVSAQIINSYLMPILSSLLVIVAGILLSVLMGQINYRYFVLACCLFLVIGASIFLGDIYRSNLRYRDSLSGDGTDQIIKFDRLAANTSAVSNLDKIVDFEGEAREIWILGYDLSWEIENHQLWEKVAKNLENGVKYRYLLQDSPKLRTRAKILLDRVVVDDKNPNHGNFEIRFQKTRIRLLQFGVTIYDPDIVKLRSGPSPRCVVAFFPRYESVTSESSQRILVLAGNQTTSIQEDYLWLWENDSVLMDS